MPPTATVPRPPPESTDRQPPPTDRQPPPTDAAVRIVYQAVRTLVPTDDTVALSDITAVARLDPGEAAAAMNRLVRRCPFGVSRRAQAGEPAWHVRRTDRRTNRRTDR